MDVFLFWKCEQSSLHPHPRLQSLTILQGLLGSAPSVGVESKLMDVSMTWINGWLRFVCHGRYVADRKRPVSGQVTPPSGQKVPAERRTPDAYGRFKANYDDVYVLNNPFE